MKHAASPFVLLEHRAPDGTHWDLMIAIENGGALATWRLAENPIGGMSRPIAAERIADHRVAYLEYEGEISGGRGVVRRLDRGEAHDFVVSERSATAKLIGQRLRATWEARVESSTAIFTPLTP